MAKVPSKFDLILQRLDQIDGRLNGHDKQFINLAADLASLTRTVDRIDQRLVNVERQLVGVQGQVAGIKQQTDLIPGMSEALSNQADDLNRHERLLKKVAGVAA